jgi:hypothetical protein
MYIQYHYILTLCCSILAGTVAKEKALSSPFESWATRNGKFVVKTACAEKNTLCGSLGVETTDFV